MPIIRSSRVLYRRLLPVVFGALVFKLSVWCGAEGYVSGLRAAQQLQCTVRRFSPALVKQHVNFYITSRSLVTTCRKFMSQFVSFCVQLK